jgi:predicted RNA-binding protein YlqC (UPF0109 family)
MNAERDVQAVVIEIVRLIVDDPALVRVTRLSSGQNEVVTLIVHVPQIEMEKFVGGDRQTSASLTTILKAMSAEQGTRFRLEIVGD